MHGRDRPQATGEKLRVHGLSRQAAGVSAPRHLLVDGSNVLHAWWDLREIARTDRDAARAVLLRRIATIHDAEEVRVTIVYDGRGSELSVEHPAGEPTLTVIHSPSGLTADDVIEQMVARTAVPATCLIATDDRAECDTVRAMGAMPLSTADLQAWVARAEARQATAVDEQRARVQRDWP
jgi:predicted RNA-binding protein with PIN domain